MPRTEGKKGQISRTQRSFRVLCLPREEGGWVVRESFPEGVVLAQRFERGMRIGQAKWSW